MQTTIILAVLGMAGAWTIGFASLVILLYRAGIPHRPISKMTKRST